jgi:hypothetical protein
VAGWPGTAGRPLPWLLTIARRLVINRSAIALAATLLAYGARSTMAILREGTIIEIVGWPTVGGNTVWLTIDRTRRIPCPPEVDASPAA